MIAATVIILRPGGGGFVLEVFRFLWNATRGHRLRPWRSDYLRWRFETYTGKPANEIGAKDFWSLARTERRQLLRFFVWTSEMRSYANGKNQD